MKSIVLGKVLATAMLVLASNGNVNAQSLNHEAEQVYPFYTTTINVPSKVKFVKGRTFSVEVIAEDEEVEKGVRYQVVDGVLCIYLSNGMDAENIDSEDITIIVSTPFISDVETSKEFVIE